MYKILTLNKISHLGTKLFDPEKYNFSDMETNPDAIIVRSAKMHDMEFSDNTLAIARAGAGVNNIPIEKSSEKGIVVFNTPGANANAVKELVLCSLLISSRKIIAGLDFCKSLQGKGEEIPKLVEKGKSAFTGPEIKNKKLGVIGLGAIGISVANSAIDLGMDVYGYDPYLSVDAAWNLHTSVHHAKTLDQIFSTCDYITLHVPCNEETANIISETSIFVMKKGVRILNFARGELVNTDDIIRALENGKVSAYATDFPDEKLISTSGVIAFPHLGASTPESEDNCAKMAVTEIMDYIENGTIKNSVNMPNAYMERSMPIRLCVIHRNIPKMLNKITEPFTEKNININDMLNRSKGDYAYTMVDISDINDDILDKIKSVEGIIRVRVIK